MHRESTRRHTSGRGRWQSTLSSTTTLLRMPIRPLLSRFVISCLPVSAGVLQRLQVSVSVCWCPPAPASACRCLLLVSLTALQEILEAPERLRDLDLEAFSVELERQGYGQKLTTLYDIRAELNCRYKDTRSAYKPVELVERFNMLTKETPATLYIGESVSLVRLSVSYICHSRTSVSLVHLSVSYVCQSRTSVPSAWMQLIVCHRQAGSVSCDEHRQKATAGSAAGRGKSREK